MAATASPGQPVAGSRNEVWLCQAYSQGQGLLLYVKPALGLRRMMVEVLAAQLAQCMRLPCPAPYLVTVKPHHVGRPRTDASLVAFASEAAGTQALARPVKNLEFMLELLDKLHLTETACVFDEWIANPVRSPSDILFDPASGAVIIDHEGAMQADVQPDQSVTNWLADRIVQRTPDRQRMALLRALRARAAAAHRAQLGPPPGAVQFVQDGVPVYTALVSFVSARLQALEKLLSQRVIPEQGTLL